MAVIGQRSRDKCHHTKTHQSIGQVLATALKTEFIVSMMAQYCALSAMPSILQVQQE